MRALTIGEVARQAGVGVETIRFYERRGLVERPLKPRDSGFRIYLAEQIRRIKFIRQAQQIGFSLREIQELLSLRADPAADCSTVRNQAANKLEEVRGKIEQLRRIESALEGLIAVCPGRGGLQACTILDTLAETAYHRAASTDNVRPVASAPLKRTPDRGRQTRSRNDRRKSA